MEGRDYWLWKDFFFKKTGCVLNVKNGDLGFGFLEFGHVAMVLRNVCEITCRFGRRLFDADIVGETVA
ncbi:MAG: hypothetical protein CO090_01825 [Acidobacteria bacterium CG_4_9_14_3_um_filter_49_7]|nr:MAG: hypothetical protein CO090_01825 [Acidobacteria bacterium CG_4_9_14_3_um_filter_49_7]